MKRYWIYFLPAAYLLLGAFIASGYTPFSGGGTVAYAVITVLSPSLLGVFGAVIYWLYLVRDEQGLYQLGAEQIYLLVIYGLVYVFLPIFLFQASRLVQVCGLEGLGQVLFRLRYHSLWLAPTVYVSVCVSRATWWPGFCRWYNQSKPICHRPPTTTSFG